MKIGFGWIFVTFRSLGLSKLLSYNLIEDDVRNLAIDIMFMMMSICLTKLVNFVLYFDNMLYFGMLYYWYCIVHYSCVDP